MNSLVTLTSTRTQRALDRFDLQTWLFVLALAAALFLVAYPLFLVILNSFRVAPPGQPAVFGFDGWRTALSEPGMRSSIYNTPALVLVRQAIAFPIAILVTWIIARTDIPWRGALEFMLWLSFFLPARNSCRHRLVMAFSRQCAVSPFLRHRYAPDHRVHDQRHAVGNADNKNQSRADRL